MVEAKVKMAKSKQNDEVTDTICTSLRSGIPFERSCKAAGISKHSGHNWRRDGWLAIEKADPDSDEPLGFTARFAIEVEQALVTFMEPLVKRVRDAAAGEGKGDWRAAQQLLASRFPNEWSERTHVAKSQRLEVAGHIGVNTHGFEEFVALRKMTLPELLIKSEKLKAQIDNRPISGQELDDEISFLEDKVTAMKSARAGNYGFTPSGWMVGNPAVRPISIDLEAGQFTEAETLAISHEDVPVADGRAEVEVAARSTPGHGGGAASTGAASPFPFPVDDEDTSL